MIVKVQRSLFSPGRERVLIYNRTESVRVETDLSPELRRALGDSFRKFFSAELRKGTLSLKHELGEQGW